MATVFNDEKMLELVTKDLEYQTTDKQAIKELYEYIKTTPGGETHLMAYYGTKAMSHFAISISGS